MAAIRAASLARWGSSRLAIPAFRRQMATISAAQVKELREATGAPILQCKVALQQPDIDGDFDAAVRWLREQGMGKAAKKASREAAEGLVGVKVNSAETEAVLVEVCHIARPKQTASHMYLCSSTRRQISLHATNSSATV